MSVAASLFGDKDFIAVRAALIAEVGAIEAIVLTRIHFRASESYRQAYERDGEWWWRAPVADLATETGLSEKQVRRALDALASDGHVIAEQHQIEGRYDRAYSYRVALDGGQMHLPQRANEDLPQRANVPTKKAQDTPLPPDDLALFEEVWQWWPKKAAKKDALKAWTRILRSLKHDRIAMSDIAIRLKRLGAAHRKHTPPQFWPMLSTILNGERWDDPLPVDRTRGAHSPEPSRATTFTIPPGHRALRDEHGHIIGSEPL